MKIKATTELPDWLKIRLGKGLKITGLQNVKIEII
jgi:hypothetical protein